MRYEHSVWVDHDRNPLTPDQMGETPYENGVGELTADNVAVPRPEDAPAEDPREAKPKTKDPRADKGKK